MLLDNITGGDRNHVTREEPTVPYLPKIVTPVIPRQAPETFPCERERFVVPGPAFPFSNRRSPAHRRAALPLPP